VIATVAPARVGPNLNVHRLARHQLQTYQVWNSAVAFGAALDSWNSGVTISVLSQFSCGTTMHRSGLPQIV
jgi:hypothetical protein